MMTLGRNDPCSCGSGKKFKHCCLHRQHNRVGGLPQSERFDAAVAVQSALEHHSAGRLMQAGAIYRQVLSVEPSNFDALHLLGVTAYQLGEHAEAINLIGQAIRQRPNDAMAHNNLGNAYRALSRFDEALDCLQKALRLEPNAPELHSNLGETFRVMGRLDEAHVCFSKALALNPKYAEAHNNLGLVLRGNGRMEEARASFQQALSCRPNYPKALKNMGDTCYATGLVEEAMLAYQKALSLRPEYAEVLFAMGSIFNEHGNFAAALEYCQRAIRLQPQESTFWVGFSEIVRHIKADVTSHFDRHIVLQALKMEDVDPQSLEHIASALVCDEPLLRQLCAQANHSDAAMRAMDTALSDVSLNPLFDNPLLLEILRETVITDYRLEKMLTALRRALLASAMESAPTADDGQAGIFISCLALQCFANEYLYAVNAAERRSVATLTETIRNAVAAKTHFPAAWLMLLGCYEALYRLPFANDLQAYDWPQNHIRRVIERQLIEPAQEESIKNEIPQLTPIGDGVSQAVRAQYEENPYPRWRRRGNPGEGLPLHVFLKNQFPACPIPDVLPTRPEMLVAGCGTGSESVQLAQRFKDASILAVDMSVSSLAYARRATEQFGIHAIDYRQADILKLGSIGKTFDIIVCGGVLHHMHDPLAGWKVLSGLLRPGGYMRIGLYSRRARRAISAIRQGIVDMGGAADAETRKRFRFAILDGNFGLDCSAVVNSVDFFSTSACRDLIFHVEEHLTSPLEIAADLARLGLNFMGFEMPNQEIKRRYLARFPENIACDSLSNWDVVEEENPEIFAGMFQLWVNKAQ